MPPKIISTQRRRKLPSSSDSSSSDEESVWVSDNGTEETASTNSLIDADADSVASTDTARVLDLFRKINRKLRKEEQAAEQKKSSQHSPKRECSNENIVDLLDLKKRKHGASQSPLHDTNSSKSSGSSSSRPRRSKRLKAKQNKQENEYSDEPTEDDDYSLNSDYEKESNHSVKKNPFQKFNILFSLGEGGGFGKDYESEDFPKEADMDEEFHSEDEAIFMKDKYSRIEDGSGNNEELMAYSSQKNRADEEEEMMNVSEEYLELIELKKNFTEQLKKKPKNKILQNSLRECNSNIQVLIKNARHINTKTYHSLVAKEKTQNKNSHDSEMDYFKKKLSNDEQLQIMEELKEINRHMFLDKPYRLSILQSNMPAKYKAVAIQKLNTMMSMDVGDNEYFKIKNWIDAFMRIPFGITRNLSISIADGVDKCHDFIENAKNTLDTCVYGLNDAKVQIMQMLGQWLVNPNAIGTSIAIHGPPGTGKTSIVKDGISKILGREFAFIALGGTGDSSFLEGHSYTYEGSTWGKIAQILMDSKCMNPVIYFDELDKVSDTPRGQEIIGILTHLTDTTQNSQFHDKYFSEISFDISKCLFIFSYNDENLVNPILRDRLYRIKTKGYTAADKLIIAKKYLLPKIREQVAFREDEVIIPDDTINYIINSQYLTQGESGVRNLKRCLEIIYTKLNLFRVVKPDNNLLDSFINMKVSFPYTVTRKDLDILIKKDEQVNQTLLSMYI